MYKINIRIKYYYQFTSRLQKLYVYPGASPMEVGSVMQLDGLVSHKITIARFLEQ